MATGVRIAFLCDRLGPYHLARLNAAASRCDLTAIEFSASDDTYEWDPVNTPSIFQRITLFSEPINRASTDVVIRRVHEVLDHVRPEVVAIPGWDALASLVALQWSLDCGIPTILMSDSQRHDAKRVWWKEAFKRQIAQLHSCGFVAGSSHVKYLESLGIVRNLIQTGLDVVDNAYFHKEATKYRNQENIFRQRLGLPEKYFLACSRFVPKKNLLTLLEAYALYKEHSGPDRWHLVLVGDGELRGALLARCEELGIKREVILPGFKQYYELPAYYGLAEAFVHASTTEQWGLVVNEAMACGLPVIVSTPCGCVPELVAEGSNGFTFDPLRPDELAEHMTRMSSKKFNKLKFSVASCEIIANWSLDVFTENLILAADMALGVSSKRTSIGRIALRALIHGKKLRSY